MNNDQHHGSPPTVEATSEPSVFEQRSDYSKARLGELEEKLQGRAAQGTIPNLTIFCAGSFARGEASEHSDLDLFLVQSRHATRSTTPRTDGLRLLASLIEIADELRFPSFTDDCKYLKIHREESIADKIGSPSDDYFNHFTLRMLMLLESKSLFGHEEYHKIKTRILERYYIDYHDHEQTFQPTFLLNDISRFWKTMLLNYENSRNETLNGIEDGSVDERSDDEKEADRIKAKVKNFKLKFSRMTTCFATIAAIGINSPPVGLETILGIVSKSPQERLLEICDESQEISSAVRSLRMEYEWFLNQTAKSKDELHGCFRDLQQRADIFDRAEKYRWSMIQLLSEVDKLARSHSSHTRGLIDTLIV